jgi:hypothetical protein
MWQEIFLIWKKDKETQISSNLLIPNFETLKLVDLLSKERQITLDITIRSKFAYLRIWSGINVLKKKYILTYLCFIVDGINI